MHFVIIAIRKARKIWRQMHDAVPLRCLYDSSSGVGTYTKERSGRAPERSSSRKLGRSQREPRDLS